MWRIMPNIDSAAGASPSIVKSALKILWRQCSLLACANIISSTSLGLRPSCPKASTRGSRSRRRRARARNRRWPRPAPRGPGPARRHAPAAGRPAVEEVVRGLAVEGHALGHAVVQQRGQRIALVRPPVALAAAEQAAASSASRYSVTRSTRCSRCPPMPPSSTVARDVAGLAGPGRDRAQPRHDDDEIPARGSTPRRGRRRQQRVRACRRARRRRRCRSSDPVHIPARIDRRSTRGHHGLQRGQQRLRCGSRTRALPPSKAHGSQVTGGRQAQAWHVGGHAISSPGRCDGIIRPMSDHHQDRRRDRGHATGLPAGLRSAGHAHAPRPAPASPRSRLDRLAHDYMVQRAAHGAGHAGLPAPGLPGLSGLVVHVA